MKITAEQMMNPLTAIIEKKTWTSVLSFTRLKM